MRVWLHIVILAGLLLGSTGCKSMTPGQLSWIQTTSDRPHAGNVYLLRGFIGIWSYGIDHLGEKINAAGVRASVFQEDQWSEVAQTIIEKYRSDPNHEPLVLIGHSYGADDVVKIAKRLQQHGIEVDLVITLDPVTPPAVPANIRLCYNIYQPNMLDALPFFRGVALAPEDPSQMNLQNVNIRAERRDLLEPGTDHFNIEKNQLIHAEVVAKVREFCPPREQWASQTARAGRATSAGPSGATPSAAPLRAGPTPQAGLR
jgi:predicted alpha/beta hydrolase family esterase